MGTSENALDQAFMQQLDDLPSAEPVSAEVFDEAEHFFPTDEEADMSDMTTKPKKRRLGPNTKRKWTDEEEREIREVFERNFRKKTRPSAKACEKAIAKSRAENGALAHRSKDTLKKKIFRMIDKLQ